MPEASLASSQQQVFVNQVKSANTAGLQRCSALISVTTVHVCARRLHPRSAVDAQQTGETGKSALQAVGCDSGAFAVGA